MLRYNRFPDGKIKCFTLSYDDGGCADRKVVEIMNRFGVKGTFHLNSSLMGRPGRLGEDEVKTLYEGHEIATHSATHPSLTQVPTVLALQEVLEDRKSWSKFPGALCEVCRIRMVLITIPCLRFCEAPASYIPGQ